MKATRRRAAESWPPGCVIVPARLHCPNCDRWAAVHRHNGGAFCAQCCPEHGGKLQADERNETHALDQSFCDMFGCAQKRRVQVGSQYMPNELQELLDAAKVRAFPASEREAQRRSFAYGNTRIENPRITRQMVDEQAEKLRSQKKER
jgi:hypothetical protein